MGSKAKIAKYIIKKDKQKGNNYDYDFIEIDKEAEHDSDRNIQKML